MSGHSKWSNIKHRKGKSDAQKGKIFTKLGRELAVAVRSGGPEPESNIKLKDVITKAKTNNMPNESIWRSIKKAAGDNDGAEYEDITYEGYGPSGIAVIVECLTDNRNRTAGDIRHYFDKFGGNMGQSGCVSFMFDKKGIIIIEQNEDMSEDKVMEDALMAGADDFNAKDSFFEISTEPENFTTVCDYLEKERYTFASAELEMVPQTYAQLTDEKDILLMNKLIDMLEDNDDVQNVYHNWEQDE